MENRGVSAVVHLAVTLIGVPTVILILVATNGIDAEEGAIGITYGKLGSNLPPPTSVASFLASSTIFTNVRLFDTDPETLAAFAHTGISLTVTVPNSQIPSLTSLITANNFVSTILAPSLSAGTNITRIFVGNEVLSSGNFTLIFSLLPAMECLHSALITHSLDNRVQISTPHSLGILSDSNPSSPPSGARFQSGYDTHVIGPMLRFLRVTRSPFVVNPYPFFGTEEWNLGFALFRNDTHGVFDGISGKNYSNMFDAQMDAVFSAMKDVGFEEVEILVGETGWPSSGDPGVVGADLDSAQEYNRKLIQHVRSGSGTPLMPNRTFEVYLFALFDEDLKPGPTTERHFGLFKQDFSPVYDAGVVSRPPESLAPASVSPSAVDGLRCDWHWAILIWVLCALVC